MFYEGQRRYGIAQGFGRMIKHDGEYYIGQWQQSKRHGLGKQILPDGTINEGIWENDVFIEGNTTEP